MDLTPTPEQTVGPFFHLGCTQFHSVSCIAGPNTKGERLRLICRLLDGDGIPVDDGMLEIWQADADGRYPGSADRRETMDSDFGGYGRVATDRDGTCIFETVKPGRVPGNGDALQAPHFNLSVFARGVLKRLVTRIYFAEDAANSEDPVLALVPQPRRSTLMAHRDSQSHADCYFEVRLCGENETVFFDV
jgi:protocatechuate 3,4-dioxygenase, alpha subunit